jgi:hypothetical protein
MAAHADNVEKMTREMLDFDVRKLEVLALKYAQHWKQLKDAREAGQG